MNDWQCGDCQTAKNGSCRDGKMAGMEDRTEFMVIDFQGGGE